MGTDILNRIDSTLFTVRDIVEHSTEDGLCCCGCGEPVDSSTASGWWATPECMEFYLATAGTHLRQVHIVTWPHIHGRPAGLKSWGDVYDPREFKKGHIWYAWDGELLIALANVPGVDDCALMRIPETSSFSAIPLRLLRALLEHVDRTKQEGCR